MIPAAKNELMTQVGPQAPAGRLLRRYWQPVALAEELAGSRPLKALRLMGQDLVLFRDESGRLGLLDRDCPHRGADLAAGRLEHGGLRCLFHGWLFDVEGQCLQTPAEPLGSPLCSRIRQGHYPVLEKAGVIWAYLGPDVVPPVFPELDCFVAPDSHSFAFKGLFECNWLQALEVGMDPAHASFLHRYFEDENTADSYGKQFRGASADSDLAITQVLREFDRPQISVEASDSGLRLTALREISPQQTHVRVTNVLFPQAFVIPMSADMIISQWHVPVDDRHTYWVALFTSFGAPVDKEQMRQQRLQTTELPHYRSRRNKANHYGYDEAEQRSQTFTGMGLDINVHDQWAVESQGPIQDRTREHLGTTDRALIAFRRLLLGAIAANEEGRAPPQVLDAAAAASLSGPAAIDGVHQHDPSSDEHHADADSHRRYWQGADLKRRQACEWAAQRLQMASKSPSPASAASPVDAVAAALNK